MIESLTIQCYGYKFVPGQRTGPLQKRTKPNRKYKQRMPIESCQSMKYQRRLIKPLNGAKSPLSERSRFIDANRICSLQIISGDLAVRNLADFVSILIASWLYNSKTVRNNGADSFYMWMRSFAHRDDFSFGSFCSDFMNVIYRFECSKMRYTNNAETLTLIYMCK